MSRNLTFKALVGAGSLAALLAIAGCSANQAPPASAGSEAARAQKMNQQMSQQYQKRKAEEKK